MNPKGECEMKKSVLVFVLFMTLLLTLAGCHDPNAGNGVTTPNTTEAPTAEVTQPAPAVPDYTAETEVFDSFSDMKEYVALFKDQLPCTRSTKGYYAVGDGGAASYRITAEQPAGISEKLANGCYAQIVTEETFVVPQQFGAYANGKKDDTVSMLRVVQYASDNNLDLKLPEGEYYTKSTIVLDQIDVYCENAKISFYGLNVNVPAVDMKNDVNVYGKLHIWVTDNLKNNNGERCNMGFGDYGTGAGAHNCYVEDLTVSGGCPNANGVFITGDSSNITLDKVTVPEGTNICRGVLLHWGNSEDYRILDPNDPSKGIVPEENNDPTKHPHDIHIGSLICSDLDAKSKYGDAAAIFMAAAYNVTVDEILVDDARCALMITCGDMGFLYAPEELRAHGMKNLKVGKIKATNMTNNGIYFTMVSSYVGDTGLYAELELGEVDISFKSYGGVGVQFVGIGKLRANAITLQGLNAQALHFTNHSADVEINTLNLINCRGQALYVTHLAEEAKCSDIRIKTLNIGAGCGSNTKEVIYADSVNGLTVDSLNLSGATYKAIMSLNANCSNVHLGSVSCSDSNVSSVFYANNEVTESNNVSIGSISGQTIPLTAGASCTVKVGN